MVAFWFRTALVLSPEVFGSVPNVPLDKISNPRTSSLEIIRKVPRDAVYPTFDTGKHGDRIGITSGWNSRETRWSVREGLTHCLSCRCERGVSIKRTGDGQDQFEKTQKKR